VINTKKALDELSQEGHEGFMLTVIVDNEAARENVSRFARTKGFLVTAEEKDDGIYVIIQEPGQKGVRTAVSQPEEKESCCCAGGPAEGGTVLIITSSALGQGSEELGKLLMRSFIYSLKETGFLPSKMSFLTAEYF